MKTTYSIKLRADELNEKFGGGIPKGSTVLIEAVDGMGKSILSQRLCYGAIKNGHKTSYISTELPVNGFLNQMDSIGYEVRDAFLKQDLKFVSLYSALGSYDFETGLIQKILGSKELMSSDLIFFDTLSDLLIDKNIGFQESFALLKQIKNFVLDNKTLVFSVNPENIPENMHRMLSNTTDVYIIMEEAEVFGSKQNMIRIKRFNGARGELETEMSFKVRPNIGIVVELANTS